MAAFVWRTRAAPVLHVNTFLQNVCELMYPPVMQWACAEPVGKAAVLRVLRFVRSSTRELAPTRPRPHTGETGFFPWPKSFLEPTGYARSEERRVGKECRSRWSPYH